MKRKLICFHKGCSYKSTKLDDISSAACINQDEDIGYFVSKNNAVDVLIEWVTGVKRLFIVFSQTRTSEAFVSSVWRVLENVL